MTKIKVRFHLGAGKNFMKWQIKDQNNNIFYYEPEKVSLKMINCTLKNRVNVAKKIYNGEHKTVCAWIECDTIEVLSTIEEYKTTQNIQYNPKKSPHWLLNEVNIDNYSFLQIVSLNRKLFLTNE